MIKKLLIIAFMVFACGTSYAQEYDPYQDYNSSVWRTGGELVNNPGSKTPSDNSDTGTPPHGGNGNAFGNGEPVPIVDGIVLLIGLGAAYALRNRKKNE